MDTAAVKGQLGLHRHRAHHHFDAQGLAGITGVARRISAGKPTAELRSTATEAALCIGVRTGGSDARRQGGRNLAAARIQGDGERFAAAAKGTGRQAQQRSHAGRHRQSPWQDHGGAGQGRCWPLSAQAAQLGQHIQFVNADQGAVAHDDDLGRLQGLTHREGVVGHGLADKNALTGLQCGDRAAWHITARDGDEAFALQEQSLCGQSHAEALHGWAGRQIRWLQHGSAHGPLAAGAAQAQGGAAAVFGAGGPGEQARAADETGGHEAQFVQVIGQRIGHGHEQIAGQRHQAHISVVAGADFLDRECALRGDGDVARCGDVLDRQAGNGLAITVHIGQVQVATERSGAQFIHRQHHGGHAVGAQAERAGVDQRHIGRARVGHIDGTRSDQADLAKRTRADRRTRIQGRVSEQADAARRSHHHTAAGAQAALLQRPQRGHATGFHHPLDAQIGHSADFQITQRVQMNIARSGVGRHAPHIQAQSGKIAGNASASLQQRIGAAQVGVGRARHEQGAADAAACQHTQARSIGLQAAIGQAGVHRAQHDVGAGGQANIAAVAGNACAGVHAQRAGCRLQIHTAQARDHAARAQGDALRRQDAQSALGHADQGARLDRHRSICARFKQQVLAAGHVAIHVQTARAGAQHGRTSSQAQQAQGLVVVHRHIAGGAEGELAGRGFNRLAAATERANGPSFKLHRGPSQVGRGIALTS